jgi:hypothetical protein
MSKQSNKKFQPYRIVVKGQLSHNWQDWFGPVDLKVEGENSVIIGRYPDQAALHGTLNKIRDLNLVLLKVEKLKDLNRKDTKESHGGKEDTEEILY